MRRARKALADLKGGPLARRLRRFHSAFAAIVLAHALGACAIGPDYVPPWWMFLPNGVRSPVRSLRHRLFWRAGGCVSKTRL